MRPALPLLLAVTLEDAGVVGPYFALAAARAKVIGDTVFFFEPQKDPGLAYVEKALDVYRKAWPAPAGDIQGVAPIGGVTPAAEVPQPPPGHRLPMLAQVPDDGHPACPGERPVRQRRIRIGCLDLDGAPQRPHRLSGHRPTSTLGQGLVDLLVDEVKVYTLVFELTVEFDITGVVAVVQRGKLVSLRGGPCELTVTLTLEGKPVLPPRKAQVDLPLIVPLNPAISLLHHRPAVGP